MPYNKEETRKAKKAKIRSDKPLIIEDNQMQKHKSKGLIRGEE
ncbi:hypothetical protein HAHI6034_04705 [Hathewaya histolytica]|uniref:Uncharacterized protein n=1 Tax=Hathewaya histolytica TaxID=1498 RepID=A0A4U9R922_HATHI|nr:hypothetical protein [Hathewaya histolytica]VTQ87368.1 Uncharacterised protein [Hathewaya histolytica]